MKKLKQIISVCLLPALLISYWGCKKSDNSSSTQQPAPTPAPAAAFSYTGGGCIFPCTVTFTNTSTNSTSYSWDFGDGNTSTETNPVHTYTTSGNFSVQLTSSGNGSNSIIHSVIINSPTPPTAAFTISGGGCQAPCVVTFTNTSTNATTYSWDFGDGGTSTATSPTHTYTTGGNFNVQLTANGSGSNAITHSVSILAPPTLCKITGVSILNCSLTDGGGSGWDFGNAPDFYVIIETTSSSPLYTSGYYTDYGTFPQSYTISPSCNFSNTSFSTYYRVHIWDYDCCDPDDDVASVSFRLSDYATVANHYPTQFTIISGITQIKLTVTWQ